ncbi:hypothetical protein D9M70_555440 [compost metagenome]
MLIALPLARSTWPRVGRPVTVMVRLSPSASVAAVRPRLVPTLSSATTMLLLLTTGRSFTGVTPMVTEPFTVAVPSLTL